MSREKVDDIKEKLLGSLKLTFKKIANSLYYINGKRVNVKLTTPRQSGRYWFNIQRKADSYIWICYNPEIQYWEAYYWIPAEDMWLYIKKGSYRDRTWEEKGRPIPNFEIDTEHDLYVGKNYETSIRKFRNLETPP